MSAPFCESRRVSERRRVGAAGRECLHTVSVVFPSVIDGWLRVRYKLSRLPLAGSEANSNVCDGGVGLDE